jgi:predicted permease
MTKLRAFLLRVLMLFRLRRTENDLDEEIQSHLQMQADDHRRAGMSFEEAREAALRDFGGVDQIKERYRDRFRFRFADMFLQDARLSLRMLRKNAGLTAIAAVTLGLGIGINVGVFTVANAVLFKGFGSVVRNDRLLYITSRDYGCCVSYLDFEDWRAEAKSFQQMAIIHGKPISFADGNGFAENFDATEVSSGTFRLVGVQPIAGRDFEPADEEPGASPVAILSYDLWERRYGKDPATIGKLVQINGVKTTVIGVMARHFSFPQKQELWIPLVPTPNLQKRDARTLWCVVGRLADGATKQGARAELETIGRRLASAYPLTNEGQLPVVQSFPEFFIGPHATAIYGSLWGAVGFVLLIACSNLANLMLARAIGRSREISVRIALGAGRWRIFGQLLIESVMLSIAGGVVGWWIAKAVVRAYALAMAYQSPWLVIDYTTDYRAVLYLFAVSIGTGLLFGLAPALRLSKLDINDTLKNGGRSATSGGHTNRLSSALVAVESRWPSCSWPVQAS